jgi:hypothetical protein
MTIKACFTLLHAKTVHCHFYYLFKLRLGKWVYCKFMAPTLSLARARVSFRRYICLFLMYARTCGTPGRESFAMNGVCWYVPRARVTRKINIHTLGLPPRLWLSDCELRGITNVIIGIKFRSSEPRRQLKQCVASHASNACVCRAGGLISK